MSMIKTLIKKIVLSCLIFILLAFSFVRYASAQENGTWYNQSFQEWFLKVNNSPDSEIFGERYTAAQVQWVIYGLLNFLVNSSGTAGNQALSCLMENGVAECRDAIKQMIDSLSSNESSSSLLDSISSRPISAVAYFWDAGTRLKIIPEARAQTGGFGFRAAEPVINLWRLVRNIAYAFLTLVIVVMAFMIMFRVKISPQTVITVQSALPKIVLALILITFSYAIAGFLVDLMYVTIGLVAAILTGPGSLSAFDWRTMFGALTSDRSAFSLSFYYFITLSLLLFPAIFSSGNLLIVGLGSALLPILVIAMFLVFIITAIKILWLLLKTYVLILIQIIIGPFSILLGTISPGFGFGSWLRQILAHLAVYPTVGLMFVLCFVFLSGAFSNLPEWTPEIVETILTSFMPFNIRLGFLGSSTWNPPLTWSQGTLGLLWVGASFVVFTLIPKVADIIKGMIEGKPFGYGTAIGEAVGPARLLGTGGLQYTASSLEAGQQRAFYGQFPGARTAPPVPWVNVLRRLGVVR